MYFWQIKGDWEDYYAILGIPRTATSAQIKAAHKKKQRDWHPDMLPGGASEAVKKYCEKQSKACNRAYDVLKNPVEKSAYDTEYDLHSSGPRPSTGTTSARPSSTNSSGSSRRASSSSGSSSRSSRSGSTGKKREEPKPPPPPPPPPPKPPKVYNPVIRSSAYDIALEATQGDIATITFQVFHESGELPPRWKLKIGLDGVLLRDANVSYYPKDKLPTTVSVTIPTEMLTGENFGNISLVLDEVN